MSSKLTDTALKALKPQDKTYTVSTGNEGLTVAVTPAGGKSFRFRYRIHGKRELLRMGTYPDLSLKRARELRDKYAAMVVENISPLALEREAKAAKKKAPELTFEAFADRWVREVLSEKRKSDPNRIKSALEVDALPFIGTKPLKGLSAGDVRDVVKRKKAKGHQASAWQLRGIIKRILDYAIDEGIIEDNVALLVNKRIVTLNDSRERHMEEPELRRFLKSLGEDGDQSRVLEVHLLYLTMLRKRELATLRWSDIDEESSTAYIPANRMKQKRLGKGNGQTVYLSRQALAALRKLHELSFGSEYVFPASRNGQNPTSSFRANRTITRALERMDGEPEHYTPHDMRRTSATMLSEAGIGDEVIEANLHHVRRGVKGIYNRSGMIDRRADSMQLLGDLFDSVLGHGNVVAFGSGRKSA